MRIIQKSKYDGVCLMRDKNLREFWVMKYRHDKRDYVVPCDSERDAAVKYDLKMISLGIKPTNIYRQHEKER